MIADFQPVGCGKNENCQPSPLQVLLIPEILVRGDQGVELPFSGGEQLTVLDVGPSHFERGSNLVWGETAAERHRRALIEKDLHAIKLRPPTRSATIRRT